MSSIFSRDANSNCMVSNMSTSMSRNTSTNSSTFCDNYQMEENVESKSRSLRIPDRLVPVSCSPRMFPIKRPHWTVSKNREKYNVDTCGTPWILSTEEVLEEIKWSLTAAMSKSLFVEIEKGKIRFNRNCQIQGLSQGCASSLLSGVMQATSSRQCLENFIMSSFTEPALVLLRSWLSDFLTKWKERVQKLHFKNCLQCMVCLRPLINELLIIDQIVSSIWQSPSAHHTNSSDTVARSWFYLAEQASFIFEVNSIETELTTAFFSISISALIFDVCQWISGKDTGFTDGQCVFDQSPVVLPVVRDLLNARKSAVILPRLSNSDMKLSEITLASVQVQTMTHTEMMEFFSNSIRSQSSVLSPILTFKNEIQHEISRCCSNVNSHLVQTLRDVLHLPALFKELKDIVTLAAINSCDIPYEFENSDKYSDRNSLSQYTDMVNEMFLNNFRMGLWRFGWCLSLVEPSIQHRLTLDCQLPFPLDLIITQEHKSSYGKMFQFFFQLECARNRLARLTFRDLAVSGSFGIRLSIQRFELFLFLTKIMAALSYEFNGRFESDSVLSPSSIDQLCLNHDQLVRTLLNITLSDDRSVAWTKLMTRLTQLSKQLQTEWHDATIRESDLINFRLAFDSTRQLFNSILLKKYVKFSH